MKILAVHTVFRKGSKTHPCVLLVDGGSAQRQELRHGLEQVGVLSETAATCAAAVELIAHRMFDLIICYQFQADVLAAGHSTFDNLRWRAAPTPVGVLVEPGTATERVAASDLAFVLAWPVDLAVLLGEIARVLHRPISDNSWQGVLVAQYFAALNDRDWDALVALCTEDVVYYLPAASPFGRIVVGRASIRAYSAQVFASFPSAVFNKVVAYELPYGIVTRYHVKHQATGRDPFEQSGAVTFRLRGKRIARIGVELVGEQLDQLIAVAAAPIEGHSGIDELLRQRMESLALRCELTPRERQVLELLLLGRSASDIATALRITVRTARFHQSNVLAKVGADSRHDLIRVLR